MKKISIKYEQHGHPLAVTDLRQLAMLIKKLNDLWLSPAMFWSLNHVIYRTSRDQPFLPPFLSQSSAASQRFNLRQRAHSLQLPEHKTQLSDCNFLIRVLYKTLTNSCSYACSPQLLACVMSCLLINEHLIDWFEWTISDLDLWRHQSDRLVVRLYQLLWTHMCRIT